MADAVAEVDRAYSVLQTSYNRLAANKDQLGAVQAAYEADKAPLDLYLDAQRRVADAEPAVPSWRMSVNDLFESANE